MAQSGKRKAVSVSFTAAERRILQRAAQLERIGWTTLMRIKGIEWAEQRLRRHRQDTQAPTAA